MKFNSLKEFIFVFIMCLMLFVGVPTSFAQDDTLSNEQVDERASEAQAQEALNQIHDLVLEMKDTGKRLDALENAIDHEDANKETPGPVSVSVESPTPVKKIPVQVASHDEALVQQVPVQMAARTQEVSPKLDSASEDFPPKENQFTLAGDFSYFTYREPIFLLRDKGTFYGIYGAYDFRPQDEGLQGYVLHLGSDFKYGLMDYKSTSGVVKNIKDHMIEPRVWLGRDISLNSSTRLTPFGGIGYRYLFDHFGAFHEGGYDRRSQYLYAPVGIELNTQAIQGWEVGLDGEYDIFIRGWQTTYLSDLSPFFPNLNNTQEKGFGWRGSLNFVKKMDKVNFLISPYIKYWHIKQSNTVIAKKITGNVLVIATGDEPDNNATEIGLRLGVEF